MSIPIRSLRVVLLALFALAVPCGTATAASALEEANLRLYEEAIRAGNAGDFEGLGKLFDESFEAELNGVARPGRGPEVELEAFRASREAFPDYVDEVEQVIAHEDFVAARWRMRGTHEGKFLGIPAMHRRVELAGCTLLQIRDGRARPGAPARSRRVAAAGG